LFVGFKDDSSLPAERVTERLVRSFYDALMTANLETLRSILTKDVVLTFGPYKFLGLREVGQWAIQLKKIFPHLGFSETSIKTAGNEVTNVFVMKVIGLNKLRGRLPCSGRYSLRDGKIYQISIKPSEGILDVTFGDIMRLMLI